jgi:RNA-directed DNA polymerase
VKREKPGRTYPAEGPNTEKGRTSMSSHDMMNPNGGVHMGRVMEPFDPDERLLEKILSKENMAVAWKRVKSNKGAPGVDGISIEQFPEHTRPL